MSPELLNDPWLKPFEKDIEARGALFRQTLSRGCRSDLSYCYGRHPDGVWHHFREYAPNATALYLLCDAAEWQPRSEFAFHKGTEEGVWELDVDRKLLPHNAPYKLWVEWNGGSGERISPFARYVTQDAATGIFTERVWEPQSPYQMHHVAPKGKCLFPAIYECHVGMSSEEGCVATYNSFREDVLPRVVRAGYNCIQLMAIQEHPYYGSFGYHVSNFFAPSSRFGNPDELKALIDEAHALGLRVIMDIVHSHAVKNVVEGLGAFDGTRTLFFSGEHPAWDSLCFDYGKPFVKNFLLSNCRYWLEQFGFDGFRFDGVTSMLYHGHGLGKTFTSYADYYNTDYNEDAGCYLMLANELVHRVKPDALTIAEEVSGMPGIALPLEQGGFGFNYRLAMNQPDYWIKTIKELPDEAWDPGNIFFEMTNRRHNEAVISYAESHDQALVGDKTLIFRLADAEMYHAMNKGNPSPVMERALALVNMIKTVTFASTNGGILSFMGNEFGHPEWIDFPREGNGNSFLYARRQWSLSDNPFLRYEQLARFDEALVRLLKQYAAELKSIPYCHYASRETQVLAFSRGRLLLLFNFAPAHSYDQFELLLPPGKYTLLLDSDRSEFGGFARLAPAEHFTAPCCSLSERKECHRATFYLPARTVQILLRE